MDLFCVKSEDAGCVSILMEELEMEVLFKEKKTLDVINRITGNA